MKEHMYEIRVEGHLGPGWSAWLGELQMRREAGRTVLYGPLVDQAALHGVLQKIRDLGLTLISVNRLSVEERYPDFYPDEGA